MDSEPHGEEDVEEDGVEEKEAAEAAVQGAEEKAAGEDMVRKTLWTSCCVSLELIMECSGFEFPSVFGIL